MKNKLLLIICMAFIITVGGGIGMYSYLFGFGSPDDTPPVAPTLEALNQQVVYRIDPLQSEVRYSVDEIFLRENTMNTAVGVTHGIAGDILIDFEHPEQSQVGTILINLEQFESDSNLRDGRIRKEYLESSTYPEARFEPTSLLNFPENPVEGETYQFQIDGDLTVKETTAPSRWDISVMLQGDTLTGTANTTILMSTYDVGPIDIAGLVETEDEVELIFDFTALQVEMDIESQPGS